MKWFLFNCVLSVLFTSVCRSQSTMRFAAAPSLEVGGMLGDAIHASDNGRLKYFITGPDSRAIRIYNRDTVRISKSEGWEGECAGKWLYSTALAVQRTDDEELKSNLRQVADYLLTQQDADGYLGTFKDSVRFTGHPVMPKINFDLWMNGYVMQGLMQTATALHDERYLTAAKKIADLCLSTFGPGRKSVTSVGPWRGMASGCVMEHFVDLYTVTQEKKYLDFARYCLDDLDRRPDTRFVQRMLSTEDVSQIGEGKMYEMLHCLVGVAKLYQIEKTPRLRTLLDSAWTKIHRHLNAAGGPSGGVHAFYECYDKAGFFSPYSFNETCATMDWIRFNKELLGATAQARYAEELEHTAYNAALGASFADGRGWVYHSLLNGIKQRTDPFACCSSSGAMLLEEIPGVMYGNTNNALYVNVLGPSAATVKFRDTEVQLNQETNYPLDGRIRIIIQAGRPLNFDLRVRIPVWCEGATVTVHGVTSKTQAGRYFSLARHWNEHDTVLVALPMRVRTISAQASDTIAGRSSVTYEAIFRGPLLYATAHTDTKDHPDPLSLAPNAFQHMQDTARGRIPAFVLPGANGEKLLFVPYAAVGHPLQDSPHTVWVRRRPDPGQPK